MSSRRTGLWSFVTEMSPVRTPDASSRHHRTAGDASRLHELLHVTANVSSRPSFTSARLPGAGALVRFFAERAVGFGDGDRLVGGVHARVRSRVVLSALPVVGEHHEIVVVPVALQPNRTVAMPVPK